MSPELMARESQPKGSSVFTPVSAAGENRLCENEKLELIEVSPPLL